MTIQELYDKFPTKQALLIHLEKIMWPVKPICAHCNSTDAIRTFSWHKCNSCLKKFKVTTGTIFDGAKGGLHEWFLAYNLISKSKKHIPIKQLAIYTGVTRRIASRMSYAIKQSLYLSY